MPPSKGHGIQTCLPVRVIKSGGWIKGVLGRVDRSGTHGRVPRVVHVKGMAGKEGKEVHWGAIAPVFGR